MALMVKKKNKKTKNWPVKEMQDTLVQSLSRENSEEEDITTHSVFLSGESHKQRSLVGCSPWDHKRV